MVLDFLVFGDNVEKAVKMRGFGDLEDAARGACWCVEQTTGRECSTAVLLPGDRSLDEMTRLTQEDLMALGPRLRIFEFG